MANAVVKNVFISISKGKYLNMMLSILSNNVLLISGYFPIGCRNLEARPVQKNMFLIRRILIVSFVHQSLRYTRFFAYLEGSFLWQFKWISGGFLTFHHCGYIFTSLHSLKMPLISTYTVKRSKMSAMKLWGQTSPKFNPKTWNQ